MFDHAKLVGNPGSNGRPPPYRTRAAAILACGLAISLPASAAIAPSDDGTCTPRDAYVEVIPALGEPQIEVPNEDYVPAVAEESEIIEHPAVYRTKYQRFSWNPSDGQSAPAPDSTPATDSRWTANTSDYEGAGKGSDPIGVPFQRGGKGGSNASWFYWTTNEVLVSKAWTEKVITVEARAEQGSPTKWVPNPLYQEAKLVHHEAVVCEPVGSTTDPDMNQSASENKPDVNQPGSKNEPGEKHTTRNEHATDKQETIKHSDDGDAVHRNEVIATPRTERSSVNRTTRPVDVTITVTG